MDKFDDAFQALDKINQIVTEFRNKYPEIKQKEVIKIDNESKAFKLLKDIERITKNYNKNNAEMKLKNIIGLLGKAIVS